MKSEVDINSSQDKQELNIKRPCLVITDLEKSLEIYQDILGFKLDYLSEASSDSYLYKLFELPLSAKVRFASLSTEKEPRALALTEVKNIEITPQQTPHRIALVVRINDINQTIARLSTIGLKIIEPNYFQQPPNLNFTEQAFCDRDGHLIMLYEVKVEK